MKTRLAATSAVVLALAATAILALPAAGLGKPAKKGYDVYATCANGKPFKPAARHCRYDGNAYFRATFVFKSHSGKHPVKTCFHIYGHKPLAGGACVKLKPLAFKAYPFKITGIRQKFSVKVSWYVNDDGSGFHEVGSSFMKVKP